MQSPVSPVNTAQQLTFTKILTQESLFHEIWAQLKQQQRQLFVMCQSNKDYQVWKEKFKTRVLNRNIITYFAIVQALKSMLIGNYAHLNEISKAQNSKNDNGQTKSSSNGSSSLLKTSNISNPYSHLLCFRLLKDSFLRVDYGLLTLIEAELGSLIFNVSIYDSGNQDEQRGRSMYLQGLTASTIDSNLPMTHDQLEIVGYSVQKIVLETLITLGSGLPTLPYHLAQAEKDDNKQDQSGHTQRPMTPRTVNSTFTSEFQRQKMKALSEEIKKYPLNAISSISSNFYAKTKKMSVKYPEKLHYFKQKEIQKFKKQVGYNSEHKQYHILKFYEFLIGFVIREQSDRNKRILENVKLRNESQFGKFSDEIKSSQDQSFKGILRNIMRTKDRYALYFTILNLSGALKILTQGQKGRQTFSQQWKIVTFFSICEIVEYLTVLISKKNDLAEKLIYLELEYFSLEMFLAVDSILSHFLVNAYLTIFEGNHSKTVPGYFYEYSKLYFYNLIAKFEKIRELLIVSNEKTLKKQFLQTEFNDYIQSKQSPITAFSQLLLKFYPGHSFSDSIAKFNASSSDKIQLQRFQLLKNHFQISIPQIHYTKVQIPRESIDNIKKHLQVLEAFNMIHLAASKCPLPSKTDQCSIPQQKLADLSQKFLEHLNRNDQALTNSERKTLKFTEEATVHKEAKCNDDSQTVTKKHNFDHIDENDDEIPKESFKRPKSIDAYKFKINANDISKLNLSKAVSQTNFHPKSDQKPSKKVPESFKLSFKQSLEHGTSRLNLMNRDTQTLRNLSRRKYKRKHTNSRARLESGGTENFDEAMSCPTYIDQNSETMEFAQTFQDFPSQQKIAAHTKQMQKIMELEREIQQSKQEQEKLMNKIKKQEEAISQLMTSEKKKQDPPKKPRRSSSDDEIGSQVFSIKDSISKRVHKINVGVQDQVPENTEHTGNSGTTGTEENKQILEIKDTDSYEVPFYPVTNTPNHSNKTKMKSRFNEANDDSIQKIKSKFNFDSSDKKLSSIGGSGTKKDFTTPDKFWKGKDALPSAESEPPQMHLFHFPIKLKKDLLKKKVLIVKDQIIQIGMITLYERVIPSEKTLSLINEGKKKRRFNYFKLKSSMYITPLTKLKRIELSIKDPEWLEHEFLTNKIKQNLKADSQYISYVDFWLVDIENHKKLNYLPDLEVKIEIDQSGESKPAISGNKSYKFNLPLFANKFFIEESLDELEIKALYKTLTSVDEIEIQVSQKLAKQVKDLEKYFAKFVPLPLFSHSSQKLMATKLSFMNESIYICFGKDFGTKIKQSNDKQGSKLLSFQMISGSELISDKNLAERPSNECVSNLLITSMFSLLTD